MTDSGLEPDLVVRLRSGDSAAFERCFRTMHAPLVAFVARYVGDVARAEDVVQELFFALWRDRAKLEITGSLRAYLFSGARNRALNVRRRDLVERDWEADEAHADVRAFHPAPETPDATLEAAELTAQVASAFATLPERCRLAMHLRWREGLSYAEIAQVLGIGVKGVENQLARGLKALRARLAGP
ncbi:RNA polymerase sigma-70 factor [Gemmatimonas groenlandica]|uniref:RNA polymerase sigma-70 factor n=1 Tax=Gemmatimonas groenlandica TaxID=2732249 RepID=A0A6M4IP26_9BACT|nr:RNA polymerase sigma-70 factor [Gemmatimonas groenlandica]QJR35688.1 RNA polymerase sigma-70 factor [Gemmatimonas groenlandica]